MGVEKNRLDINSRSSPVQKRSPWVVMTRRCATGAHVHHWWVDGWVNALWWVMGGGGWRPAGDHVHHQPVWWVGR